VTTQEKKVDDVCLLGHKRNVTGERRIQPPSYKREEKIIGRGVIN